MDSWETSWNRDVLERIVVLLFALASLADHAASAPYLRRRRVLGILSHGEAEARAFLIGMSPGAPVTADALESTGDAKRLAARLRALALLLCAMLAQTAPIGAAAPRTGRPSHKTSGPAVRWLAPPPAPDTS
jgi:hypothetical protein